MISEIVAVLGALGALVGGIAGGRHVMAQARKVQADTKSDPMARAVETMERTMARLDAEVARLSAQRDADRARIQSLEEDGRRDRQSLREALHILTHPVAAILDWIDAGAQPPPPHESAASIRRRVNALDRDLTD